MRRTRLERLVDGSPLKPAHFNIWIMSALGIFMDGLDLFIIAVALPLLDYQFSPTQWELGLVGAASPIGAIFGAIFLGHITDKFGRKKPYVASMVLFVIFSFLSAIAWNIQSLIVFRFLLGIGIGADYPISSTYLSEFMPKRIRSRAIISAFSFQALGALGGATLGLITLIYHPRADAWRYILAATIFPALIIGYFRTKLPESVLWLQSKHEFTKASEVMARILKKRPEKVFSILEHDNSFQRTPHHKTVPYKILFSKKYLPQTLLTSIPWFIMDICLYGVGVFSAVILAKVYEYISKPTDELSQTHILTAIRATTGAMLVDIFLVVGFISAIFAIKKLGSLRLQNVGFLGMTFGLLILGIATSGHHNEILVFIGFSIFNLMVNFGPNPTTYMLPTERFPPHIRATGHGFAASAGKVGAAIGILFLPVFIHSIGIALSMFILAAFAFLGFLCTVILGRKGTYD